MTKSKKNLTHSVVKIIRPSKRQLIVKTSGNLQHFVREFVNIAPFWMVVMFAIVLIRQLLFPTTDLQTILLLALFPYVGCGCIGIATARDHTTRFDLDTNTVRIECYWVLFKIRQCQHYDLTRLQIVVAEHDEVDWFYIKLRPSHGEDIYICHSSDRDLIAAGSQEIQDFLDLNIE